MMRSRRKSLVWKYYGEVIGGQVECVLCNHVLKYKPTSRSTTNLFKHLISKHQTEAKDILATSGPGGSFQQLATKLTQTQEPKKPRRNHWKSSQTNQHVVTSIQDLEKNLDNHVIDLNKIIKLSGGKDIGGIRKSKIWQFFTIAPNSTPDNKKAVCGLCNRLFAFKYSSSSNLRKHIKNVHPSMAHAIDYNDVDKSQKSTTASTSSSHQLISILPIQPTSQNYSYSYICQKTILDEKVVTMIAVDLQPVSIVEREGFIDLMEYAVPSYTLPNKETISTELLPNLYKNVVGKVLEKIDGIRYFALTTDLWSPRKQEIYLSITGHFISPTDWTLQSVMLSTTTFYGNPSAKDIASELQRVVGEWNISDKITVMVTDNDTNNILANEQLPWPYIPCLGQLIHLVVKEAIATDKEATALIEKVNDIVHFFHHDQEAAEKLAETTQCSLPASGTETELPKCKLVLSVPQRWNSIFYMLESVNDTFDAVNTVMRELGDSDKLLSTDEREMIKKIIGSLKPFEVVTTSLSLPENNIINMAMPLIKGLVKMMATVSAGKELLTENLKLGINQSFGKIEEIECIIAATMLDPRFKTFPFAAKDVAEKAKEIIISDVAKLLGVDDSNGSQKIAPITSRNGVMDPFWDLLGTMSADFQEVREVMPPAANREVQRFLESPPVPKDENVLSFWKQHSEMLPNLSKVALKYLAVPITSIPANSLFTTAGDSLVEKRSALKPCLVNMILFLNKNLNFV